MFAQPTVHQNGSGLHVSHGDDKNLFVEFSMMPELQKAESEKQGRPIYADKPYITIMFPGDKTKKQVRPVRMQSNGVQPSDPERFPRQWASFQNQQSQIPDGTRLEEWGPCSRSDAMNLKHFGIHTVEQMAELSDTQVQGLPIGSKQLRDKAIAFIAQSKDGAAGAKYAKENADLKADLAMKDKQIQDLAARLEALEKGEKKTLKLNKEN